MNKSNSANKRVWYDRVDELYSKIYNKGEPWTSRWEMTTAISAGIGSNGTSIINTLCKYSNLASRNTHVRKYDLVANDAMLRLVEPVLRGYIEIINELGGKISIASYRKSVPSKSRLSKIYSQYVDINFFNLAPYDYRSLVNTNDELSFERAYYLLAIKNYNDDVELAREYVKNFIINSWRLRHVTQKGVRNKYEYVIHPDLTNSQIENWMQYGREIYRTVKYVRSVITSSSPHKNISWPQNVNMSLMRSIVFGLASPVYFLWYHLQQGTYIYEGKGVTGLRTPPV